MSCKQDIFALGYRADGRQGTDGCERSGLRPGFYFFP